MVRGALAALVLFVLVDCGGGQSPVQKTAARRAAQARDVARGAGLPGEVQEFLARYAAASGQTFSVTYALGDSTAERIVIDQQPPHRRVDVTGLPGGGIRSEFQLASGSYACVNEQGDWSCQRSSVEPSAPGALTTAALQRTVEELRAARAGFAFRIGDRRLAGARATCLVTTPTAAPTGESPPGTPKSLCLSPQGAPLLLESSGETLRAVRYADRVDGERLRLPAPPRRSP